jgi:hypothetical protein
MRLLPPRDCAEDARATERSSGAMLVPRSRLSSRMNTSRLTSRPDRTTSAVRGSLSAPMFLGSGKSARPARVARTGEVLLGGRLDVTLLPLAVAGALLTCDLLRGAASLAISSWRGKDAVF